MSDAFQVGWPNRPSWNFSENSQMILGKFWREKSRVMKLLLCIETYCYGQTKKSCLDSKIQQKIRGKLWENSEKIQGKFTFMTPPIASILFFSSGFFAVCGFVSMTGSPLLFIFSHVTRHIWHLSDGNLGENSSYAYLHRIAAESPTFATYKVFPQIIPTQAVVPTPPWILFSVLIYNDQFYSNENFLIVMRIVALG